MTSRANEITERQADADRRARRMANVKRRIVVAVATPHAPLAGELIDEALRLKG